MNDIHDIKPLLSADFPWLLAIAVFGMLLGLLWLGFWLLRRWRNRKKNPRPAQPAPKLNHRELALRALKKIRPDPQHPGQFYLQLERILKEFLEGLHQQPVTGFTASELTRFMQTQIQAQNQASVTEARLEQLLLNGQIAKFAGGSLTPEQMQQDLERAIGFVKKYTL